MTINNRDTKGRSKKANINDQIEAKEVRLIGADGEQVGIVSIDEALEMAQAADLDLVEIAGDAEPIVCKIMDYGKQLFEVKKQKAAARKKQKQQQVKEMKFRPGTDQGDYQVKLRNLIRFLEQGDKAKVSLRFRGREISAGSNDRDRCWRYIPSAARPAEAETARIPVSSSWAAAPTSSRNEPAGK